jgi:hypothetical protein
MEMVDNMMSLWTKTIVAHDQHYELVRVCVCDDVTYM